jgi:hypothetical protein
MKAYHFKFKKYGEQICLFADSMDQAIKRVLFNHPEYGKNDIEYCHHYSLINPEYYSG